MRPAASRRARVAAGALALGLVLGPAACSSDGDEPSPTTSAPRQTEITGPIPPPSVTVAPGTTTPVVTQPVVPTAPAPTPGRTDPPTALPCDAGVLLAVVRSSQDVPPETATDEPVCTGGWAAMVIGVPGQDRALAVFAAEPAGWRLANLGTDGVCTDGGVPPDLYGTLGCALWETS
jgi:hypothetical protein